MVRGAWQAIVHRVVKSQTRLSTCAGILFPRLTFDQTLSSRCAGAAGTVHACPVQCFVAQSCLSLCDPMDCSPPGSSVHGILQARILE